MRNTSAAPGVAPPPTIRGCGAGNQPPSPSPADIAKKYQHLNDLHRHADRLVFGKRWWLTQHAATQPRHALGVGHLHVRNYMQAAWAQPLLSAMGRDQDRRPFKHYYARYAREAYFTPP